MRMFYVGIAVTLFWSVIFALMRWTRKRLNGRYDFWFQPLGQVLLRLWHRKTQAKQSTTLRQ